MRRREGSFSIGEQGSLSFDNRGLFALAEWGHFRVVYPLDDDFDVAVIFTLPHKECRAFKRENAVKFLTEPPSYSLHRDVTDVVCPQYLPLSWWIYSRNHEALVGEEGMLDNKTELLSTITSDKYWWDGHKRRLKLLRALDSVILEGFDIFGRQHLKTLSYKFNSYKGELHYKFDGLIPYHLACENSFVPDYFTEKIVDPIIAESLCFYDGCTNIGEYIDERALIKIDVNDIEGTAMKIFDAIDNNEYSKRYKYIVEQKNDC